MNGCKTSGCCPGEIAPKIAPEYWRRHVRFHEVDACPLTRGDYNKYRGWEMPQNENPDDEGCLVVYPDGYESWCPKAQFEEAGRPIDGMTFGIAIDACRYKGAKIQRANWNGNGQYVRYEECLASEDGKLHVDPQDAPGMVESKCFVFHFVNRKGETGIQVGWLASQADMAADDWRIVE